MSHVTVLPMKSLKLPFAQIVIVAHTAAVSAVVILNIAFVTIHDFPAGTVYNVVCPVDFIFIASTVDSFISDGGIVGVLILFFRK